MPRSTVSCWVAVGILALGAPVAAGEITWERVKLDERFRSEGVTVADVNKDGRNDVIVGDLWYEAPNWTIHEIRTPGDYVAGVGYSNNFCNYAWDVNGDGWDDLIYVGFPGAEFHWYENPQNKPGHWKQHLIWHSICNESPDFADVTGDGRPEIVLGSQPEAQLGYLPLPEPGRSAAKWEFHAISEPGDPAKNGTHRFYHGLGYGDVNRDGRTDVIIPHGWWEGPASDHKGTWTFHPLNLARPGEEATLKAADIHVDDLDLDGDNDLIASSPHAYGVWWFENIGGNEKPNYRGRTIDESYSQTHAIEFVDVNGDGTRDIVTGKRFYAHNGNDPGGKEPVVMYWYEIQRKSGTPPKFIPHEIKAGRDTGIGTQFTAQDFDGDGLIDIVLSNKKGVNVLLQRRK